VRFDAVQHDVAWEDPPATRAMIEPLVRDAPPSPGGFRLLPELGETGFSFAVDRIAGVGSVEFARRLATSSGCFVQVGHAERGPDGRGRNRASILSPGGSVIGSYDKVHPFSFAGEDQHFTGGDRLLLARCGEFVVCPMVCYDLRFPELWRLAAAAGATVFTIGASWPAARASHWRSLLIARAIENQCFVVACNRVGRDPKHAYGGGSLIVDPLGVVLAEGDDQPRVISADLDLAVLEEWRRRFPAWSDRRASLLGSIEIDRR